MAVRSHTYLVQRSAASPCRSANNQARETRRVCRGKLNHLPRRNTALATGPRTGSAKGLVETSVESALLGEVSSSMLGALEQVTPARSRTPSPTRYPQKKMPLAAQGLGRSGEAFGLRPHVRPHIEPPTSAKRLPLPPIRSGTTPTSPLPPCIVLASFFTILIFFDHFDCFSPTTVYRSFCRPATGPHETEGHDISACLTDRHCAPTATHVTRTTKTERGVVRTAAGKQPGRSPAADICEAGRYAYQALGFFFDADDRERP